MKAYPRPGLLLIAGLCFLVLISPLLIWTALRILELDAFLGLGAGWYLAVGLALLLLTLIAVPVATYAINRIARKRYSRLTTSQLLANLEGGDLPWEEARWTVEELARRKESSALPSVVRLYDQLLSAVEQDSSLLLLREAEIVSLAKCLASLGATTQDAMGLIERALSLAGQSGPGDPVSHMAKKRIHRACSAAASQLKRGSGVGER